MTKFTEINIRIAIGVLLGTIFGYFLLFKAPFWALDSILAAYSGLAGPEASLAGSFLGSVVGLMAVGLSALLGFLFLIQANKHQALLRRIEEEKNISNEQLVLAGALTAELLSYADYYQKLAGMFLSDADRINKAYSASPKETLEIWRIPAPEPVIFNANAHRIGLLYADPVLKIVAAYHGMRVEQYSVEAEIRNPTEHHGRFANERAKDLTAIGKLFLEAASGLDEFGMPDEA